MELDELAAEAWSLRLEDLQESYRRAIYLLEQSEIHNYQSGIADACKTLGYCYWRFSDYSLSLSHSLRALKLYQKMKDRKGEADTLNSVGAVYMFQEDHVKRLEVNQRCKTLREEIGDMEGVASSEGNIGETYFEMNDFDNARKCFENCLASPHASPQGKAWAYHNLGRVSLVEQDSKTALHFFQQGLDLSLSVNYTVLVVDSLLQITELYVAIEAYDMAIASAEKCLDISRKIGTKEGEKKSLYHLSKVYELLGKFKESLRYHKDYHTIDIEISRDTEIERLKTAQLKVAYDKIEEQKNELVDSIRYAERIQTALLTRDQQQSLLIDYYVLFEPKDIVSGDFYWYYEKDGVFYIAVADCTGHGVPGAFLTMIGTIYLNEIIALHEDASPSFILDRLREHMVQALSQSNKSESSKDGMDISLLRLDVHTRKASWAGAFNPLWVVRRADVNPLISGAEDNRREGKTHHLYELKGDKFPIGFMETLVPFTNREIQLEAGDSVYLFSDGFMDQFGGPQGKKFLSGRFKDTLLELQQTPMQARHEALSHVLHSWKGSLDQVDDICVFNFEVS